MSKFPSPSRRFSISNFLKTSAAIILILVVAGAFFLLSDHIKKFGKLAAYPNQACVGVGTALKNGIRLKHYTFDAHSNIGPLVNTHSAPAGFVGQHSCSIGTVVTKITKNKDGTSTSSGYELGAVVQYFKNADIAKKYAATTVNHTHSWSVDEAGVKQNIPQTSLFTFIVTNTVEPYFDSYTVRGSTVILQSLPCPMSSQLTNDQNFDVCNKVAQKVLKEYADTVQQNLQKKSIF
jgi:hypothetical protein